MTTESEQLPTLGSCPSCGKEDWAGLDQVLMLPIKRSKRGRYKAESNPGEVLVVAPACRSCGYMALYDMGFLTRDPNGVPDGG
jgi:hypothetical protein